MTNKTMSTLAALAAAAVLTSACATTTPDLASKPADNAEVEDAPVENTLPDPDADPVEDTDDTGDTEGADVDDASTTGGDKGVTTANLAPISTEDSSVEIIALIDSLHGPTEDIQGELAKLMPFTQVPTPAGSHIMAVEAYVSGLRTGADKPTATFTTSTEVKVDGERADIVELFEAELAPLGWSLDSSEEKDDGPTRSPGTFLDFEKSGEFGSENLSVDVVSDEERDITFMRLAYRVREFPDVDKSLRNRFAGWHGEVPLFDGAEANSIEASSQFGPGRSKVQMSTSYVVDDLPTEDKDELRTILIDKAAAEGIEIDPSSSSGVSVIRDNLDRLFVSASVSHTVRGEAKVITPPFDGVEVVAQEKSEDPLPVSDATADEIQAVVSDIYGPTADVSTQMQRIGVFPDVPTPNGADIVNLRSSVENVIGTDDFKAAVAEVEMFIDGEYDDVNAYYDAQLAALGWTEESNKTEKTDDGLSTERVVDYKVPQEASQQIKAKLTITDDVDDARTKVNLSYSEFVPVSDSGIERWQSWFGDSPFPEGGELFTAGISTFAFGSSAVFFQAEYQYPGKKLEDMISEIETSFADSNYIVADGEKFVAGENTKLVNTDFVNADVWLWDNYNDGGRIALTAARRLD